MYESAFPRIGEIGATICSLCEQFSLIILSASSICSSSQPIISVVFPSFKNPPVVANLVVWKFSLLKAVMRRLESRSEEHTSELQSRFDLVCRLLLEKK